MNLASKKTILKAYYIFYLILICIIVSIYLFAAITIITTISQHGEYLGDTKDILTQLLMYFSIGVLVAIVVYLSLALFYRHKSFQNKEQFYNKIIVLKIISFVELVINPLLSILIFIAAFKKDDGLDEIIDEQKKSKPKKVVIPKELQPKLNKLKSDRRRGYISSEAYEKQYNKLVKEAKRLEEESAKIEEENKPVEETEQTTEEQPNSPQDQSIQHEEKIEQ